MFYVSPSGDDSANGSLAAPWKTLQKALLSTGCGDTVNLRTGNYAEAIEMRGDPGNRFGKTMGGCGADGKWTIQSAPGELATITAAWGLYSIQYSRVQNLTFAGGSIYVGTADWVSPSGPRSHHVEILNNRFQGEQVRYGFIEVMFDASLVEGNTISIVGSGGTTEDHGIYLHNGNENTVRGNVISGSSGYGIHVYDERKGLTDPQTFFDNILIEGNTATRSQQRAGIIVSTGGDTLVRSVTVRGNTTMENATAGLDLTNYGSLNLRGILVEDNQFHDGIYIENDKIQDCVIQGNVVGPSGIRLLPPGCMASNNVP
jgi:parallel beta-helix repeat protein